MSTSAQPTELQQQPIPSSVRLERGQIETVTLNSGVIARVKVRFLPARHLNQFLDLRGVGLEAAMLGFVLERNTAPDDQPAVWEKVTPEFVDDLDDEAHARLVEIADWLNFSRAVCAAERQIATGTKLLPINQQITAVMMKPIAAELKSLTSSLITQLISAAPKTTP